VSFFADRLFGRIAMPTGHPGSGVRWIGLSRVLELAHHMYIGMTLDGLLLLGTILVINTSNG